MTVAERCRELTDRFELPPRSAEKLNALLKFVITGPSSLTNVRDPAAAVELHIADSLAGLELPQLRNAATVADLGSGGGFPGLVLAIALPDVIEDRHSFGFVRTAPGGGPGPGEAGIALHQVRH